MNARTNFLPSIILTLMLVVVGCGSGQPDTRSGETTAPQHNQLTEQEREAGWMLLFNGESLNQWRAFRGEGIPEAWEVTDDGWLHCTGSGGPDIITRQTFDDFELKLEWKISEGGNSGVFFRVGEDHEHVHLTGPEYQIIDHEGYDQGTDSTQQAGANYALHAPNPQVSKGPGEWNQARIVVDGAHVEHWMNGEKVLEYELWSDDWKKRVANSKFDQWPDYGMKKTGHLALQNHGDPVWFRDIKIRPLEE